MTKDRILELLWQEKDYLSGEEMARRLSVSRTAVWKGMEQLRAEGYRIDSSTNRGYRLLPESDVLSEAGIRKYLNTDRVRVKVFESISSTNTVLKVMAEDGVEEGLCLVAGEQTAGRGRLGRSFYSPKDSGLYLSLLLRPELRAESAVAMTACAAVAAAQAIESIAPVRTEIKWVNDVLVGGRKVCGILTEASLDCENGRLKYMVVGIGINTRLPASDFPEELRGIAGAAFESGSSIPELRCRLTGELLNRLAACADNPGAEEWYEEYRKRSVVLGKPILILSPGKKPERATALRLDRDYALVVQTEDGNVRRLNSGEVSIRPAEQL